MQYLGRVRWVATHRQFGICPPPALPTTSSLYGPLEMLSHLKKLRTLDLAGNTFTEIPPSFLGPTGLTRLETLWMHYNR